jgi:hypothetical protein
MMSSRIHDDERERRTVQFASWIEYTWRERANTGKNHTCLVISAAPCREEPAAPKPRERPLSLVAVANGLDFTDRFWPLEEDEADAGEDASPSPPRFAQFVLGPNWGVLELPGATLSGAEAGRILRERAGFFCGCPDVELASPPLASLAKTYSAGQERRAAEDLACVFFDVWSFPVDWRFCVRCWCCNGPWYAEGVPLA